MKARDVVHVAVGAIVLVLFIRWMFAPLPDGRLRTRSDPAR